jgi:hypothetical protein
LNLFYLIVNLSSANQKGQLAYQRFLQPGGVDLEEFEVGGR